LVDSRRVVLRCDGLDTVASVWLNGQCLANSSNQFVALEVSLTTAPPGRRIEAATDAPLLRLGVNLIDIVFGSTPEQAAAYHSCCPTRCSKAVRSSAHERGR